MSLVKEKEAKKLNPPIPPSPLLSYRHLETRPQITPSVNQDRQTYQPLPLNDRQTITHHDKGSSINI